MTKNANRVQELIKSVTLCSQEQARGVEQIAQSLCSLSEMTQATSATADSSSEAGRKLTDQADMLRQVVTDLSTLTTGS